MADDLTPDALKSILMDAWVAHMAQFQKDLEVRIALLFRIREVKLPDKVLINIAETCSRAIAGFIEMELIASKRIEKEVDKLV